MSKQRTKPAPKVMALSDRLEFVRSLKIPEEPAQHTVRMVGAAQALDLPPDNTPQAVVNGGSVQSFTASLKGQDKADILNCTLLAQLAANKKHDREADPIGWYKFYVNVLENTGWVIQGFDFLKYTSSSASFTIDKVALELLAAIASSDELLVAQKALKALQGLPQDSNAVQLFNNTSSKENSGSFQIAPCTKDPSGQVTMSLGAFYFHTETHSTRFLFWKWGSSDVDLKYSTQVVTLNTEVYSQVRATIVQKLGDKAKQYIADLDI